MVEAPKIEAPLPLLACGQERSVAVLNPNESRTTIPLAAEPPARGPPPAARLQRDRGGTGALPLVGVEGFGLLRCAAARGDTHHPG
jgi:hypothetical protein